MLLQHAFQISGPKVLKKLTQSRFTAKLNSDCLWRLQGPVLGCNKDEQMLHYLKSLDAALMPILHPCKSLPADGCVTQAFVAEVNYHNGFSHSCFWHKTLPNYMTLTIVWTDWWLRNTPIMARHLCIPGSTPSTHFPLLASVLSVKRPWTVDI